MFIKQIKLKNFRIFEGEHTYKFYPLNLIVGDIGTGKSSIGRMAILFALHGYSELNLKELKTKWVAPTEETYVELIIQDKKDTIVINRRIPLKINVTLNGIEVLPESTNEEKNNWIKNRFGALDYFKKFRMIDSKQGINILDSGPTALRKTLVSFHESVLSNIRSKMMEKKSEYEKFNKDKQVVYKHAPSEKRLEFLKNQDVNKYNELLEYQKNIKILRSELSSLTSAKGGYNETIRYNKSQMYKGQTESDCPYCKQSIPKEYRQHIINKSIKLIKEATKNLSVVNESAETLLDQINYYEELSSKVEKRRKKIHDNYMRLSTRLKQKDYKYTDRDVAIMSNALKELDKFYSYYVLSSVKRLEPIINSIVCKIGFDLKFKLDEKGNFDIVLFKDGFEYSYKELSTGQYLMLSIAFQISLLLDRGDTGVILADEGFENLDFDSMVSLYEILKELPFQIISIVHRFELDTRDINIIKL